MAAKLATASNLLYGQDYYLWLQQMAEFLAERNANRLDWDNLCEEIEALGK